MLTAGIFLREFVGEGIPWSHLDIAGPAFNDKAADRLHAQGRHRLRRAHPRRLAESYTAEAVRRATVGRRAGGHVAGTTKAPARCWSGSGLRAAGRGQPPDLRRNICWRLGGAVRTVHLGAVASSETSLPPWACFLSSASRNLAFISSLGPLDRHPASTFEPPVSVRRSGTD